MKCVEVTFVHSNHTYHKINGMNTQKFSRKCHGHVHQINERYSYHQRLSDRINVILTIAKSMS